MMLFTNHISYRFIKKDPRRPDTVGMGLMIHFYDSAILLFELPPPRCGFNPIHSFLTVIVMLCGMEWRLFQPAQQLVGIP